MYSLRIMGKGPVLKRQNKNTKQNKTKKQEKARLHLNSLLMLALTCQPTFTSSNSPH